MSSDVSAYFGVWVLDPTSCEYGEQPPPKHAVYTILPDGRDLWIHARWIDAEDQPHHVGLRTSLTDPTQPDPNHPELSLITRLRSTGLVSELRRGEALVHVSTRTLEDGRLHATQTMMGEGETVTTSATYDRADVKQVLVYRRDLKMRKGKIAAQCAHASMAVFFREDEGAVDRLEIPLDGPMAAWAKGRFGKVVLSVETEEDLLRIAELAGARGIPCAVITDAGKTEFKGQPTKTTVAVGPAAEAEIDAITGPEGLVTTKLA